MQSKINLDTLIETYGYWLINHRWWLITITFFFVAILASGTRHLTFVDDYRIYFSEDNPHRIAFEQLEKTYTKNDNILFVVNYGQHDIFSHKTLSAIENLTAESWKLPFSYRVDSITNFQYTYSEGDDLIVEDLIADAKTLTDEELLKRRTIALKEPLLVNRIVSKDAKTTAVMVTFQMPESTPNELQVLVPEVRELVKQVEADFPGLKVYLTGELMMDNAFREAGYQDASTLMPLMYFSIVLIMMVLLRSVIATLLCVLLVTFSVGAAMGFAGWNGTALTTASLPAPMMIMTLAVADAVHILISMFSYLREGQSKESSLVNSLKVNFIPILITSVTTAVGFLTLNFIDVPPFQDLGNITAFGIIAAFLFSMTLLPALLSCFSINPSNRVELVSASHMQALADFVIGRKRFLFRTILLVSLLLLAAIPLNKANNEFVKFFSTDIEFRRDSDFTVKNLTGVYTVEFSLPANGSNGIAEPEYLQRLERFSTWLRQRPDVVHVSTLTDTMRRLNKNLQGDDQDKYTLPENRELAAQYLFLYELSLPYGLDLNNQVNIDKSSTRLIATLGDVSTNQIKTFREESEDWLREYAPDMFSYGVGASVMFTDIFRRSTETMINGAIIGILIISIILIFALGSVKFGLLSLVPNLLPAGLAFGIWALFVGQVNMAVSLVITMTLGIVVDDTVHFLSKYLRARREQGRSSEDAIRYAFKSVGLALVVTSLSLVVGFFILAQSSFALNADSAQLTSIAIVLALAIDFLFLPPLLMLFDNDKEPVSTCKYGE